MLAKLTAMFLSGNIYSVRIALISFHIQESRKKNLLLVALNLQITSTKKLPLNVHIVELSMK